MKHNSVLRLAPLYTLLICCFSLDSTVVGQERIMDPGDCAGAIFIKDSILVCERAPRGFGNVLEIKENPPADKQWLEREHNSQWYIFRSPAKTVLAFDIIPQDPLDDIDFLLFNGAIPDICTKVAKRQVQPVRSNISRNDTALGSMCGLKVSAPEDYVRSGIGSSYSRAIAVEKGELLYLLIDYQDRPRAGFTIHFHYTPPPPPPIVVLMPQVLRLNLVDSKTRKPVTGSVTVEGMRFDSVMQGNDGSGYEFRQDKFRKLSIGCLAKGYMFKTIKVPASGAKELEVELALDPIEAGAQVILDEIRFVGNEDKVRRASQPSLYLLLHFLEQNPTTKVEIQGHVNGPNTKKNIKEFIDLSTSRARTVRDFLLLNQVDDGRVLFTGMGNASMIYPEPKNENESEANRRVEVHVVSK